MSTHL